MLTDDTRQIDRSFNDFTSVGQITNVQELKKCIASDLLVAECIQLPITRTLQHKLRFSSHSVNQVDASRDLHELQSSLLSVERLAQIALKYDFPDFLLMCHLVSAKPLTGPGALSSVSPGPKDVIVALWMSILKGKAAAEYRSLRSATVTTGDGVTNTSSSSAVKTNTSSSSAVKTPLSIAVDIVNAIARIALRCDETINRYRVFTAHSDLILALLVNIARCQYQTSHELDLSPLLLLFVETLSISGGQFLSMVVKSMETVDQWIPQFIASDESAVTMKRSCLRVHAELIRSLGAHSASHNLRGTQHAFGLVDIARQRCMGNAEAFHAIQQSGFIYYMHGTLSVEQRFRGVHESSLLQERTPEFASRTFPIKPWQLRSKLVFASESETITSMMPVSFTEHDCHMLAVSISRGSSTEIRFVDAVSWNIIKSIELSMYFSKTTSIKKTVHAGELFYILASDGTALAIDMRDFSVHKPACLTGPLVDVSSCSRQSVFILDHRGISVLDRTSTEWTLTLLVSQFGSLVPSGISSCYHSHSSSTYATGGAYAFAAFGASSGSSGGPRAAIWRVSTDVISRSAEVNSRSADVNGRSQSRNASTSSVVEVCEYQLSVKAAPCLGMTIRVFPDDDLRGGHREGAATAASSADSDDEMTDVNHVPKKAVGVLTFAHFKDCVQVHRVLSVFDSSDAVLPEHVFTISDPVNGSTITSMSVSSCPYACPLLAVASLAKTGRRAFEILRVSKMMPRREVKASAQQHLLARYNASRLPADIVLVCWLRDTSSFVTLLKSGGLFLWEPPFEERWASITPNFTEFATNSLYKEQESEFDINAGVSEEISDKFVNRHHMTSHSMKKPMWQGPSRAAPMEPKTNTLSNQRVKCNGRQPVAEIRGLNASSFNLTIDSIDSRLPREKLAERSKEVKQRLRPLGQGSESFLRSAFETATSAPSMH